MTQFCVEEALAARQTLMESRSSSYPVEGAENGVPDDPALLEAQAKARAFAKGATP